jgi:hypothetical protein
VAQFGRSVDFFRPVAAHWPPDWGEAIANPAAKLHPD